MRYISLSSRFSTLRKDKIYYNKTMSFEQESLNSAREFFYENLQILEKRREIQRGLVPSKGRSLRSLRHVINSHHPSKRKGKVSVQERKDQTILFVCSSKSKKESKVK